MVAIAIPRPSFRIRSQSRGKSTPKPRYETVVVYDLLGPEPITHVVEMSGVEIQEHLDHRARYKPVGGKHVLIGLLLGTVLSIGALFLMWFLLGVPPVVALVFAAFQATPIGAPIGWILSKKFAPKPIWLMRRSWDIDSNQQRMVIESIIHSQFDGNEWIIQEWEDSDGKHERVIPQVYRATSTFEMTEGRDEREDYKGKASTWEKLELGLVAILAISSIGLFVLFAIATSSPTPPPV